MRKITSRPVHYMSILASVLLLSNCGTVSKNISNDGTFAQNIIWPNQKDVNPLAKGGSYPTAQTLALLRPGLNKTQIQKLIGPPQFSEGIATREWDYLFNIPNSKTGKNEICQYKVLFNKSGTVGSQYWLPEQCGEVTVAAATQEIRTDGLFKFDEWEITQLKSESMQRLEGFARQKLLPGSKITVTAYTDRLGTKEYNQLLSERRATAIKNYLIQNGMPANQITAYGAGDSAPVSKGCTANLSHGELINCLAPDRRVEITVKS